MNKEEIAKTAFTNPVAIKLANIIMTYGNANQDGDYIMRGAFITSFSPSRKRICVADAIWGAPRYVYDGYSVYKENIEKRRAPATMSTIVKYVCQEAGGQKISDFTDDGKRIEQTTASTEAQKAGDIVSRAKAAGSYKNGGSRFDARTQVKVDGGSNEWVQQDVNMLFKTGDYLFSVPVHGKTNDYAVTIIIVGFLDLLNATLKNRQFAVPTFQSAVMQGMSSNNVKVSCQCGDWLHRGSYIATVNGTNAGRPESRPAIKTNPQNKEIYCKHILSVLSSKIWATRVARTLFNYIIEVWKTKRPLFDKLIRPALNDITDEKILSKPEKTEQPEPVISETSSNSASTESVNTYYEGRQVFDEDQEFMLSIVSDGGMDIRPYVTPENTPDQILELGEQANSGTDISLIQKLASEPTLSYRAMQVICNASKENIDLYEYRYLSPDVLQQVLRGVKLGVPVDKIALKGFNYKQIEQLVRAYRIDVKLYEHLVENKFDYNKMREEIKNYKKS